MPLSSGLHLVAACDTHKRQLVSRRRILKYSMYTMIQAPELRATAGRAAAAGHWPENARCLRFSRGFCTQGALKKRDNDSTPPQRAWACRTCVYSSTNAPTAAQWNVSAGQKSARAASPSRSVAQAERGGRPDKTVQARAHRADSANIPQGIQ